jgi:hypothetical protein
MSKLNKREEQQLIVDKILETLRNVSVEGISSGQTEKLSPLEVIVGSLKAIQMMGLDGTNREVVDQVLEESRRVYDKATADKQNKTTTSNSFLDPNPSKMLH